MRADRDNDRDAERPRVLLVHPGTQHAPRLAAELERRGVLFRFWTGLARSCGGGGRRSVDIPPEKLRTLPWVELAALALARLLLGKERVWHWRNGIFQRLVPQREIEAADAVIGFDTASWVLAARAKRAGKRFVLDQSVGHPQSRAKAVRDAGGDEVTWSQAFVPRTAAVARAEKEEHDMADIVVAASSFSRCTLVENGVPQEKIAVLPYGVGEEFLAIGNSRERRSGTDGSFRFLYTGYLTKRKGVEILLDAWTGAAIGDAELRFVGGGEHAKPCPTGVVFLGQMPRGDLLHEMEEADAFVFPSLFEGFALVILEAMAAGLPVITTPNTAGPDLIENGVEGYIVPAGDAAALRGAMERLRADPAKAKAMGQAAHRKAAEFTWTRYGDAYVQLLRDICGGGGR